MYGIMGNNKNNVALFVKNLTAVGKSLLILTTSLFLVGCGAGQLTHNSYSTTASAHTDYANTGSTMNVVSNYFKWSTNRMSAYDRKQQEQAVFFALNTLKPGEITDWYNGNTGANGKVMVAASYPQGSGYCKTIFSQIVYKGKQRDFSETACINSVDNTWLFLR